ncbi:MAG: DUF3575 domain-containing protein [Bacteroidota bacterium]|nr:DUF3575 domain-containing protein [Bacteroidota bacterium]
MAQNSQISLGADVGIPFGDMSDDGASLILGPTLGFEVPVGRVAFTLQGGYSLVFVKEKGETNRPVTKGWNMIPVQLGLKYFFSEPQMGWYVHGQGGIHSMIRNFNESTTTVITVNDNGTPDDTSDDTETSTEASIPSLDITSTLFSYALGVGYQSEKVDVSLRYQGIGADEEQTVFVQLPDGSTSQESVSYPTAAAYSYIGIRIAYLFNLGGGTRSAAPTGTP